MKSKMKIKMKIAGKLWGLSAILLFVSCAKGFDDNRNLFWRCDKYTVRISREYKFLYLN